MLRVARVLASSIVLAAWSASASASPGSAPAVLPETMFELAVPGGLAAAARASNDRLTPDRSQFLLDLIRRAHKPGQTGPNPDIQALLTHLSTAGRAPVTSPQAARDTVPLPLPVPVWTDVIFNGKSSPATLFADIVRTPAAGRVYTALLSLDDETRAWLLGELELLAEIVTRSSSAFLVAAPALRVHGGVVVPPGGADAAALWQTLTTKTPQDPAGFVRELVTLDEGRLAYFYGTLGRLPEPRLRAALQLDRAGQEQRLDAARRLLAVFQRLAAGWRMDERPFWRPPLDPASLVLELGRDDGGRVVVPGTARFWSTVFNEADPPWTRPDSGDRGLELAVGEPIDIAMLSDQVFRGGYIIHRRAFYQVLFASRVVRRVTPDNVRDAVDAVRAVAVYPALAASLERAGVTDPGVYAAAARRAAAFATVADVTKQARLLAQFQGALAVVTRAAARGGMRADAAASLIASSSAIAPGDSGDYQCRMVDWLATNAAARRASGPAAARATAGHDRFGELDGEIVEWLSALPEVPTPLVEWEGTRYRVDLAGAEATRLSQLLGDQARPYLSSALTLCQAAAAFESASPDAAPLPLFDRAANAAPWEKEFEARFQRLRREVQTASAQRRGDRAPAALRLRLLADDLLGRGLTALVYASALGNADRMPVSAGDAASRHLFTTQQAGSDRSTPWAPAVFGADRGLDWHATGSLLALDVQLAEFVLVPLSARPPLMRPTLGDADRRVFVESAVLMRSASFGDADREAIAAALAAGRRRVTALKTREELDALATEIDLGPLHRTLLAWIVAHDPDRREAFFSATELVRAASPGRAPALAPWGVSAEARNGCLCLDVPTHAWDSAAGRWESGIPATLLPDLNLRIVELLAQLKMPAALLGPVLTSATLDLVTSVASRDPDDRRAIVDFVRGIGVDRLEQYLALLTTDGPLVPVGDAASGSRGAAVH